MDADGDAALRIEDGPALALIAAVAASLPAGASLAEAPDRQAAARAIEVLSARLLSSHSATAVLEAWCGERGLSNDPRLVAVRVPGPDKPIDDDRRARLGIGPDEPVRYRHVRLTCGGHVLSEADNWYVPSRLTPAMNTVLETTQVPFGRVVHPLAPTRRNLSVRLLWTEQDTPPEPDRPLLQVEAVLSTGAGVPFCEVAETYTGAILLER